MNNVGDSDKENAFHKVLHCVQKKKMKPPRKPLQSLRLQPENVRLAIPNLVAVTTTSSPQPTFAPLTPPPEELPSRTFHNPIEDSAPLPVTPPSDSTKQECRETPARNKRKDFTPTRCLPPHDPSFAGAAVRIRVERSGHLSITGEYQYNVKRKALRLSCQKHPLNSQPKCYKTKRLNNKVSGTKKCWSCSTLKTPMWRDAEDGTPLCNACGIRYKKYRSRCVTCGFIPRKETRASTHCPHCGGVLHRRRV